MRSRGLKGICPRNRFGAPPLPGFGEGLAIPGLGMFNCPVDRLVAVAAAAGIGDTQFFRHQRVGRVKAVIGPVVDLHVGRLGHMALDAAVAGAAGGVETVLRRLDDWCVHVAVFVATHAEHVVLHGEGVFEAMGIVAIHAGHPGVGHPAHFEGGMDKDFIPYLPVCIVEPRLVGQTQAEMVVVGITGHEGIGGQLISPGVAGRAILIDLVWVERRLSCVVATACGHHVGLQPCVALCAGKALLHPGRLIAIFSDIQIFLILGGVTVGAIRVPVHALPSPVPPFARHPVFTGKDVHPLVLGYIIGRADRLQPISWKNRQILSNRGFADHASQHIGRFFARSIDHLEREVTVGFLHPVSHPGFLDLARGMKGVAVPLDRDGAIRFGMVAALPFGHLFFMTLSASLRTDFCEACSVVRPWENSHCFFVLRVGWDGRFITLTLRVNASCSGKKKPAEQKVLLINEGAKH